MGEKRGVTLKANLQEPTRHPDRWLPRAWLLDPSYHLFQKGVYLTYLYSLSPHRCT